MQPAIYTVLHIYLYAGYTTHYVDKIAAVEAHLRSRFRHLANEICVAEGADKIVYFLSYYHTHSIRCDGVAGAGANGKTK